MKHITEHFSKEKKSIFSNEMIDFMIEYDSGKKLREVVSSGKILNENQFLKVFFEKPKLLKYINEDYHIEIHQASLKKRFQEDLQKTLNYPIEGENINDFNDNAWKLHSHFYNAVDFIKTHQYLYLDHKEIMKLKNIATQVNKKQYAKLDEMDGFYDKRCPNTTRKIFLDVVSNIQNNIALMSPTIILDNTYKKDFFKASITHY